MALRVRQTNSIAQNILLNSPQGYGAMSEQSYCCVVTAILIEHVPTDYPYLAVFYYLNR